MTSIYLQLAPVLLLVCNTLTHEAGTATASSPMHRDLKHSALQERDTAAASGSPPALNTTELCLLLSMSTIASSFSEECGAAFTQMDSATRGSEEEKKAIEEACTVDCAGKLIQFFKEECQNPIIVAPITWSLVGSCAESDGVPCLHITHRYNWTALESNCDLFTQNCSDKCTESVSNALKAIGCCTNYDHKLTRLTATCKLNMPELCQDPFKVDEKGGDGDKTEKEEDKTEGNEMTDKPDDGRISEVGWSGGSKVMARSLTSFLSFFLLSVLFSC